MVNVRSSNREVGGSILTLNTDDPTSLTLGEGKESYLKPMKYAAPAPV